MSNLVKLSSIATLPVGFVGTMAKHYAESGVPLLRSLNIKPFKIVGNDMKYVSEEFSNSISKSILHEGDVIIVRTGIPGTCCVVPAEYDGCNCSDVVIVHPNTALVEPHYLAAFINVWGQRQVQNNKVGAIQQHFNVHSAEEMLIFLPDLDEQKRIASVIVALNSKIDNNNVICNELETMAKTIYDYWFTQFDFPDANGKPYRTSGGAMEWNEEFKCNIPYGWSTVRLSDICTFRNGINYEKGCRGNRTYRIVNVRNITASNYLMDVSDFDEISLLREQADRYVLGEHDIIIARSGTPGATRLIMNPEDNVIFCGFIICCTPNASEYRLFISQYLKKLEGTNATKTGGSILQNVSQDTLKSLLVCLPNKATVEAFNAQIMPLVTKMDNVIRENRELTELRDWLLPMLMNGQATVAE